MSKEKLEFLKKFFESVTDIVLAGDVDGKDWQGDLDEESVEFIRELVMNAEVEL